MCTWTQVASAGGALLTMRLSIIGPLPNLDGCCTAEPPVPLSLAARTGAADARAPGSGGAGENGDTWQPQALRGPWEAPFLPPLQEALLCSHASTRAGVAVDAKRCRVAFVAVTEEAAAAAAAVATLRTRPAYELRVVPLPVVVGTATAAEPRECAADCVIALDEGGDASCLDFSPLGRFLMV